MVIHTIKSIQKYDGQIYIPFSNNEHGCFFSREDLRESMVFYDFFSRPMFARMFLAETRLLIHFLAQFESAPQWRTSAFLKGHHE